MDWDEEPRRPHPLDTRLGLLEKHLALVFDELHRLEDELRRARLANDAVARHMADVARAVEALDEVNRSRAEARADDRAVLRQLFWLSLAVVAVVIAAQLVLAALTAAGPNPLGSSWWPRVWPPAHSSQFPVER